MARSSATTTLPVAAESVVTFVTVFAFGCLVIFSVYLYKKFADSGGATLLVRNFWHILLQQLVFSYNSIAKRNYLFLGLPIFGA